MKRFLKHILLFALLFFMVDKLFYYFIDHAPKKEYDTRLQQVLEGTMNKDVIILGSSRGANNIIAEQLEKAIHTPVYNLSYPGSDVVFQAFILETLLKFNKPPKKVVLTIDYIFEFQENKSLNFRYDRLMPLKNYHYINDVLIAHNKKTILSKVFCLSRVNRSDFSLKKHQLQDGSVLTSYGSFLIPLKSNKPFEFLHRADAYSKRVESPEKLKAFQTIQTLCARHHIDLYYVFPPNYQSFSHTFLNRFQSLVKQEDHIMVYDTTDVRYKTPSVFNDETHLLQSGAAIFTKELSDFLKAKP